MKHQLEEVSRNMIRQRVFRKPRILIVSCLISVLIVFRYLSLYEGSTCHSVLSLEDDILLFPSSFDQSPCEFVAQNFDKSKLKVKTMKAPSVNDLNFQEAQEYHEHPLQVYNSAKKIMGEMSSCALELLEKLNIRITRAKSLQGDLKSILERLAEEIVSEKSTYVTMLGRRIYDTLRAQLDDGSYSKHWYKSGGSSVFLKEYGVHYSVSSLVFSRSAERDEPAFTLAYAQLFDTNWKEVKCSLLVPTNSFKDPDDVKDSEKYATLSFPQVVEIPYLAGHGDDKNEHPGIEDVHVSLIKNEAGHEEPMLTYNSLRRSMYEKIRGVSETMTLRYTRNMFVAFPFQVQTGNSNVAGFNQQLYADKYFVRTREIIENGKGRQDYQKNWVPFTDLEERSKFGYDKYFYLVNTLQKFFVLKCDLTGHCGRVHESADNDNNSFDAFQGGTQLVNVNELVQNSELHSLIPNGRQIWAGFFRTRIDNCGCGTSMYRPVLAILVKGTNLGETFYSFSHISSFIGFDIPVTGWDLSKPKNVCEGGPNVLAANGISSWNVKSIENREDSWYSKDLLTLMVSIGDFTNHIVHIEGLLNAILQFSGPVLYKPKDYLPNHSDLLVEPYTDHYKCAMAMSADFCVDYGLWWSKEKNANHGELEHFLTDAMIPNPALPTKD